MATWPQETRLVLGNMLEYLELGIDKARQQVGQQTDGENKSSLGSNAELMMGVILFSGVSNASFLSGMVLDMMNHDDYMPQAYSDIGAFKSHACYPKHSFKQYAHPYTGQLITLPVKQRRYAWRKAETAEIPSDYNENE